MAHGAFGGGVMSLLGLRGGFRPRHGYSNALARFPASCLINTYPWEVRQTGYRVRTSSTDPYVIYVTHAMSDLRW